MLSLQKKKKLRSSTFVKIIIILVMALLITMMFPKGESIESKVTVGTVWIHDDLIASTTFEILKDEKVFEFEKSNVASRIFPIFIENPNIERLYLDSLSRFNSFLQKLSVKNSTQIKNQTFLSDPSFSVFVRLKNSPKSFFGSRLRSFSEALDIGRRLLDDIYKKGVLSISFKDISRDSISIRDGKFEKSYPKSNFLTRNTVNDLLNTSMKTFVGSNGELNEALEEYILNFVKPNLIYSSDLTGTTIQNAKKNIPRNIGIVNENEKIISKHDRITPETKLKIDSYRIAKGEDTSLLGKLAQTIGKSLHIVIILIPMIIYVYLFRRKIFNDNLKILLIASIMLFISLLTFLIYQINVSAPIELLVLVPVGSMLLTIIFDSRIGFYGTIVISLIVGGLRGNDYAFSIMNIIAGGLAAYTVRDIKNRTQIFRSFLFILIGYILSIIAFGLERFDSFGQMFVSFAFAGSNALISPVLTIGLIIFFERFFNITTDLTLLELTDFNQPLLKELAKTASGTFNHSIAMVTLTETTAEAIGANPILARIGAYYHDIGKTLDPESFVENQLSGINIHEGISPEKSVRLIKDHVKKGIEIAEKQGLPKEIIDFIPMHHGTMVISYFYEKAKRLYGENNVDIKEYRYPGPKPNTKETAIVMLADACESTIRTMENPELQKVENVINNLINSRIDDGQLDESPLTFNDIKKIKESFLSILVGHQHKRIRYPRQDELESSQEE
jgi:putative nucleotidyltransferase with HDIG domain